MMMCVKGNILVYPVYNLCFPVAIDEAIDEMSVIETLLCMSRLSSGQDICFGETQYVLNILRA